MKIIITTIQAPFIAGGAELHAGNLRQALINAGHEVEIVTMPFMDNPISLIENHIVAARLFNLENTWAGAVDLCIGLKFPAYYIPHPNKVIWALHQHRAAYDLFDTEFSNLKNNIEGKQMQRIIKNADRLYLSEAKKIFANSANVAERMKKFNNIVSKPLYHPCPDMERLYCDNYENYILMPSRINITKRQSLAIKAMSKVKSNIKLYIVGSADHPLECERMLALIKELRLEQKVKYLGAVTQEEKYKLYANARAVIFIPKDEDYGYITLEAMSSSKAVITATDSGGPLEFITDQENGYVVTAKPEAIAAAIDALGQSEETARKMGEKSKKRLKEMNISWDNVVKELTDK